MTEKTMEEKYKLLKEPLHAQDIELRVGTVGKKGVTLLLYKTARVDTKRFDEIFGGRWKREHYIDGKGSVVCKISIYDTELKEWISREDVGVESNTEKEKGAYSDSLKRACSAWGSGIELYDAPFIFISCETKQQNNGKSYELVDKYFFNDAIVTKFDVANNNVLVEIKKNNSVLFSNFSNSISRNITNNTKFDYEKLKEELFECGTTAEVDIVTTKAKNKKNEMSTEQQAEFRTLLTNITNAIKKVENAN